jgi:hypothetical protein
MPLAPQQLEKSRADNPPNVIRSAPIQGIFSTNEVIEGAVSNFVPLRVNRSWGDQYEAKALAWRDLASRMPLSLRLLARS